MKKFTLIGCFFLILPIFALSVEEYPWMNSWIKGKDFFDRHDYKNAIREYTNAIEVSKNDPQCLFLYNERAAAFIKLSAYQDGLKDSIFVLDTNKISRKEALKALWNCLFCNLMIDTPNTEQKNLKLLSEFDERFGIQEKMEKSEES